ncbi:superoxide dismutase family protein [Streptomyces fumanus]|uniref:superoxide dismutase family protein n=1 Tax=Streptomyces fumanus TaxID=67302 RepID=UPI00167CF3FA|nr:superoxide dismutase family protein [Streptomyces fumanus]
MLAGICVGAATAALLASGGTGAHDPALRAQARFADPGAASSAPAYDRTLVPEGARIEVREDIAPDGATTVGLRVRGMVPGHAYGAHVHEKPCGVDPAAAGGHYQHRPGAGATPRNEVWLDFTTDARGAGRAVTRHDWGFRPGEAGSVVIHDRPGNSGARIACLTVPFRPAGR